MGDLVGFILLPLVIFGVPPLIVVRSIGIKIAQSFNLRWSGVLMITLLEVLVCFAGSFFFVQQGWGGNVGRFQGAEELYGPFGSLFWQFFQVTLIMYAFFYTLAYFSLKSLFKNKTTGASTTPLNVGSDSVH